MSKQFFPPLNLELSTNARLIEVGHSKKTRASFVGDASRVWNKAPIKIKEANSIGTAKLAIKAYCKTIPI